MKAIADKVFRLLHSGSRRRELAVPSIPPGAAPGSGGAPPEDGLPEGAAHFYDLDSSARMDMVGAAIRKRETLVSRWRGLEQEQTESWALRARRAAALLGTQRAVADIGCGLMTLEQFLSPGTRYIPVDVVKRDARTIVVDLNRQPLPVLDADALVGLGLLEYIYDVPGLLSRIAAASGTAVFSYNPIETVSDRGVRTGHAWVNHFGLAELESMFVQGGLHIEDCIQHDATQFMWRLTGVRSLSGPIP
jgi:hypothetical protein